MASIKKRKTPRRTRLEGEKDEVKTEAGTERFSNAYPRSHCGKDVAKTTCTHLALFRFDDSAFLQAGKRSARKPSLLFSGTDANTSLLQILTAGTSGNF